MVEVNGAYKLVEKFACNSNVKVFATQDGQLGR